MQWLEVSDNTRKNRGMPTATALTERAASHWTWLGAKAELKRNQRVAVCSVSLGVCHGAGRRVRHKCLERKDKICTARTTGISETPIIFIMGFGGLEGWRVFMYVHMWLSEKRTFNQSFRVHLELKLHLKTAASTWVAALALLQHYRSHRSALPWTADSCAHSRWPQTRCQSRCSFVSNSGWISGQRIFEHRNAFLCSPSGYHYEAERTAAFTVQNEETTPAQLPTATRTSFRSVHAAQLPCHHTVAKLHQWGKTIINKLKGFSPKLNSVPCWKWTLRTQVLFSAASLMPRACSFPCQQKLTQFDWACEPPWNHFPLFIYPKRPKVKLSALKESSYLQCFTILDVWKQSYGLISNPQRIWTSYRYTLQGIEANYFEEFFGVGLFCEGF